MVTMVGSGWQKAGTAMSLVLLFCIINVAAKTDFFKAILRFFKKNCNF